VGGVEGGERVGEEGGRVRVGGKRGGEKGRGRVMGGEERGD